MGIITTDEPVMKALLVAKVYFNPTVWDEKATKRRIPSNIKGKLICFISREIIFHLKSASRKRAMVKRKAMKSMEEMSEIANLINTKVALQKSVTRSI